MTHAGQHKPTEKSTEQEKLPPKLDLTEVYELQKKLDAYFTQWKEWEKEREAWLIVANRSDSFNDLAWLYEQGLRLAVARPDKATEIRAFLHKIVHVRADSGERNPEWCGNYSEVNAEEMRGRCRQALWALEEKYKELGVSWLNEEKP